MPPTVTFTKELIVKTACDLVEEQGWEMLTARNVAARLSSSTAPIYSCFASIQELQQTVIDSARDVMIKCTYTAYTERPFLNQGTGIVVFAREHREYFRLLFLSDKAPKLIPDLYSQVLHDMQHDDRFKGFTDEECATIFNKLWMLAIGMATLAFNRQLPDNSTEYIISIFLETGSLIIPDGIAKIYAHRSM